MIEIFSVGGFNEVGKNMTAIKVDNEIVIIDMGLYLPAIINLEEEERLNISAKKLVEIGAIPDDSILHKDADKVKAIILGHCHLDHIGGIPFMSSRYDCPVIGTPYTLEVLKSMLKDDEKSIKNELKPLNINSKIKISKNITVEFIAITHSTLQTCMIVLHTKEGNILYCNDFKFDNSPVMGQKPNYNLLKKLKNVKALIVESLYADNEGKTPSEKVAQEMLRDVLHGTTNKGHAIFVTTFASHIARLSSILEFGRKMNRKVLFLGRSMNKYVEAAEKLGLVKFSRHAQIFPYKNQVRKILEKVQKNREQYLIICTGSQGEPGSVLDRIVNKEYSFKFIPEDHVIFSCRTIPQEINMANRKALESKLKENKVRIFTNIHVSVLPNTQVVVNNNKSMKIKDIKDIKEDEKIKVPAFNNSAKIKWYNAKLIKHNYSGKIFDIKTKSGRNVSVTSGHSLFRLKNGNVESIKGDDIKLGDYLAIPKKFVWKKELKYIDILDFINKDKFNPITFDNKWIYYGKSKICPRKIKLDNNFARVLGYYLAEGSSPRHISLVFGAHEKKIINEFLSSAKKIFPSSFNLSQRKNAIEITFGARILGRLFKLWFGNNAKSKKIPDFVFSSNENFKINFLGSYLNGDGTADVKKGYKIRVKTASEKLASDILYLFSQLEICAKFDHIEIGKERFIGNNKKLTKQTKSYVIRIQGEDSLLKLKSVLNSRFKKLFTSRKTYQKYPPESLPISELNVNEIKAKANTNLSYYLNCLNKSKKLPTYHMSNKLIKRDSIYINGITKQIIDGDLAFDPVTKIKVHNYSGDVYDFEVPKVENFIGGFGGILLHNSGHAAREDLRDLINMVKPQNIVPAHGDLAKLENLGELATEMNYKLGDNLHILRNGDKITI